MADNSTIAELSVLSRADGSARYSQHGVTVVAAVNGPMEVSRRDELAERATVEVIVRPLIGIGGVRERLLESTLASTLEDVIVTQAHPRSLIQIVLQVVGSNEHNESGSSLNSRFYSLEILPALIQAAMLALLSASIPLSATVLSTMIAQHGSKLISKPSADNIKSASALHVFSYTTNRDLLLTQSEGTFNIQQWQDAAKMAENQYFGSAKQTGADSDMDVAPTNLEQSLRNTVQEYISEVHS